MGARLPCFFCPGFYNVGRVCADHIFTYMQVIKVVLLTAVDSFGTSHAPEGAWHTFKALFRNWLEPCRKPHHFDYGCLTLSIGWQCWRVNFTFAYLQSCPLCYVLHFAAVVVAFFNFQRRIGHPCHALMSLFKIHRMLDPRPSSAFILLSFITVKGILIGEYGRSQAVFTSVTFLVRGKL